MSAELLVVEIEVMAEAEEDVQCMMTIVAMTTIKVPTDVAVLTMVGKIIMAEEVIEMTDMKVEEIMIPGQEGMSKEVVGIQIRLTTMI